MRPSFFRSHYFRFLLALAAGLPLSACEEVVDVTIPTGPPLLVVDGAVTDGSAWKTEEPIYAPDTTPEGRGTDWYPKLDDK